MDAINEGMIDVSPHVHYVNSMRNRNLGWVKALAELIDNALDHKANQVKITATNSCVIVCDDGAGVKDLSATVTSGKHLPSESTELGMWGVGLKDAWHWAGHRMEVETVRDGERGVLVADSREMIKLGDWKINPPVYTPAAGVPSGTQITLHLAKTAPRRSCPPQNVYENLAWVFTPALIDGKQIMVPVKGRLKPLKPVLMPTLTDVIEDIFLVEGKEVYLKAGIVSESSKMGKGPFWIQYGHRNLCNKAIGCGNYDASRIGGVVKLKKGDWHLAANKDDLTDFKDELSDAIFFRIESLLKKSSSLSEELQSSELQNELEEEINTALDKAKKNAKEKRPGEGGIKGTSLPGKSGRKRRKAKESDATQDGSVEINGDGPPKKKRGVYLVFGEFDDYETLGEYDDISRRVTLNKEHQFVQHLRTRKDMKEALHAIAFSLICHWAVTNSGDQKLLFDSEEFGACFGRVLASLELKEPVDVN